MSINSGLSRISNRAIIGLYKKKKDSSAKSPLLKPKKAFYNFDSTNSIDFGRKLGSKDKKKRKVINNLPSADGQAPLNEIGQQRTGYKYYRKRRALGFIGATAGLGGVIGGTIGASSTKWATGKVNNKAAIAGTVIGAGLAGGSSLLEHASNKHSPFYQKNLFKKKKKNYD